MPKNLGLAVALALVGTVAEGESLQYPVDVALDEKGVIHVADHEAHALLKLEGGSFKAVAKGEGLPRTPLFGIRHIALDKEGRWVASDPATMKLYRIDSAGKITPIPDDDRFVTPWGIAVERSGDILAVDRVTQRLRRVSPDGKVSDVADIRAPRAICFDSKGGIVVLTDRNLMKITDAGAEPILDAPPFEFPHDVVLHPDGHYYVTDGYARAIWRISDKGEVTALVKGEPLVSPQGLAVDGKGNLLVADAHARAVFQVTLKGEITSLTP
ncbi:MAG: NHL repeat-containing protein [Acidobacteriota bacterium]